jgi:hypothetical protein
MLTAQEEAEAREDFADALLTQTARHERAEVVEGGVDAASEWQQIGALTGRLRRAKGQRVEVSGEQRRGRAEWEWLMSPYPVEMPATKRLKPDDRLIIRDGQAGEITYRVVGGDPGRTEGLLMVVGLVAIEGDR